jgi:hypothetical protein
LLIKMKSLLVYTCFACFSSALITDEAIQSLTGDQTQATNRPDTDPRFKPIESHYLTFPMISEDFSRWSTYEDAVFLKNKVILAPEAAGSSGFMHSMLPNPNKDVWVARIDFKIARDKFKRKDWMNGDGLAIYYLRTVNQEPPESPNYYGYYDDFDGIGVFVSPNKS